MVIGSFLKEAITNLESNAGEKLKPVELKEEDIFVDLHIHSKYSRATSKKSFN